MFRYLLSFFILISKDSASGTELQGYIMSLEAVTMKGAQSILRRKEQFVYLFW